MPEPDDNSDRVEKHVVYETVSSSSTRGTAVTMIIVGVIAVALIVWIVMQMR
jgi:hypothetical protein